MEQVSDKKLRFNNLVELPSGSWQIKLKKEGVEYQPTVKDLKSAIEIRNQVYVKAGYRPAHLHLSLIGVSIVSEQVLSLKSGHFVTRFQVNSRQLIGRKYSPRQYSSMKEATLFAEKHIKCYNAIAALYNGKREKAFLENIEVEAASLTPKRIGPFDPILWDKCAAILFGPDVPIYHD